MLRPMSTDEGIGLLHEAFAECPRAEGAPEWGEAPVWRKLHGDTPYPYTIC